MNGGVCVAASGPAPAMPSVFGPPQPGVAVPVSVMSAVSNGSSGPAPSGGPCDLYTSSLSLDTRNKFFQWLQLVCHSIRSGSYALHS